MFTYPQCPKCRSEATCHLAMPQCCYLAKGAKRPSHTTNMLTSSKKINFHIRFITLKNNLNRIYSLTSVLHTSLGENAQVCYSEVCVISEKDQMMKTKHGGTKYVRYSEGYTIVHVCDTEVKL